MVQFSSFNEQDRTCRKVCRVTELPNAERDVGKAVCVFELWLLHVMVRLASDTMDDFCLEHESRVFDPDKAERYTIRMRSSGTMTTH